MKLRLALILCLGMMMPALHAQSAVFPTVGRTSMEGIHILFVQTTSRETKITFFFRNKGVEDQYVYLDPPGSSKAMFLQANGRKYRLREVGGISTRVNQTISRMGVVYVFTATFEALPSSTSKFDVIEGPNGAWNLYGVRVSPGYQEYPSPSFLDYTIYREKRNGQADFGVALGGRTTIVYDFDTRGSMAIILEDETVIIGRQTNENGRKVDNNGRGYFYFVLKDDSGQTYTLFVYEDKKVGAALSAPKKTYHFY